MGFCLLSQVIIFHHLPIVPSPFSWDTGNRKAILSRTLDKKIYSPNRASYLGTLT